MLRNANQTTRSDSIEVQWYFVALVTAAIAISYFDRQTLPVAISAIQRTIPLSDQQFSWLQFAFLIPYAVLYAAGGTDAGYCRNAPRIHSDHAVVVGSLRTTWSCDELRIFAGGSLPAWDGRRRSVSCCDQSGGGVDSAASTIDCDGYYQCGNGRRIGSGTAADRHHPADSRMENGVLRRRGCRVCMGRMVVGRLSRQQ